MLAPHRPKQGIINCKTFRKGTRPEAEQVVLFISDGISQQSVDEPAERLKTRAQRVYAIATDQYYNAETLRKIATKEEYWYHTVDDAERARLELDLDRLTADCPKVLERFEV